jgi:hypothetical protein
MGGAQAIDWTGSVYRTDTGSTLLFMATSGAGPRRFHGFADPTELKRGWLYYNDDGTPFEGAPPIANRGSANG